jgi:hypothetical protein
MTRFGTTIKWQKVVRTAEKCRPLGNYRVCPNSGNWKAREETDLGGQMFLGIFIIFTNPIWTPAIGLATVQNGTKYIISYNMLINHFRNGVTRGTISEQNEERSGERKKTKNWQGEDQVSISLISKMLILAIIFGHCLNI